VTGAPSPGSSTEQDWASRSWAAVGSGGADAPGTPSPCLTWSRTKDPCWSPRRAQAADRPTPGR
jgi:hypothetical protein